MMKMHPRGGLRRYVVTAQPKSSLSIYFFIFGAVVASAAALSYAIVPWLVDRRVDLPAILLFGIIVGPVSGLAASAYMRPTTLRVSFDGHEELFKKVVEIASSGAGHEVAYEGDALLVWMRAFQPDVFKWGVRVQVEGNTATILGPVPLAMRLKNTIEVASLVAKWTLLFAPEAQVS